MEIIYKIIYTDDQGGISVIHPTGELPIEAVAAKDVPPIVAFVGTGEFDTDQETGERFEIKRRVEKPRPFHIVPLESFPLDGTLNELGQPNMDRTFRAAWTAEGKKIAIPMDKARVIAHGHRRAARAREFAPLDEVIAKQIPGDEAVKAEAGRAVVRHKYAVLQETIDKAGNIAQLKAALKGMV